MPREGDRSHESDERGSTRTHRSSSNHGRHKHSRRHRESSREHRRHRPYRRETEPVSSTHIYFNGSDNAPSVSVHTDHVTLASNLSSVMEERNDMLQIFEDCCQMLERLRKHQTTNPAFWHHGSSSTSSTTMHRGANQSNLVAVPKSPAKKTKPKYVCFVWVLVAILLASQAATPKITLETDVR